MLTVQTTPPRSALRPFVRCYVQRNSDSDGVSTVEPVVARLEQTVEFQFGTPYQVRRDKEDELRQLKLHPNVRFFDIAPPLVVVGPHTYRTSTLTVIGKVDAFAIMLQPGGFKQLFGIPLCEFTDVGYDASAVLGSAGLALMERLGNVSTFAERVRIADEFLECTLKHADADDRLAGIANSMLSLDGPAKIADFASQTGLSLRQFERRFREYTGVTPKLFVRIARFQDALDRTTLIPSQSWTTIAHSVGYHDQMHMVRDFHEFAAASPSHAVTEISPQHIISVLKKGQRQATI
jgi:AraC-like DNA-binding protein